MRGPSLSIGPGILKRMSAKAPFAVWTPVDFIDLGAREAVDQALHRLVRNGEIRRVTRGLYDKPTHNPLTGKPTTPDPLSVVGALARRDKLRVLLDGITSANDLGLSDAVPAKIVVHTDARLRSLALGPLTIEFKTTSPSKLYWAGRPGMRVVQALNWLKDTLPTDGVRIRKRLKAIFADPTHGEAIRDDLRRGVTALPDWMRTFLGGLIDTQEPAPRRPVRKTP